ncbi:MAG: hypothetical protein HQ402_02765 [Parcubacteria group bacterium]|nr:hypothetical protein [Parcubacteria group bacterium]
MSTAQRRIKLGAMKKYNPSQVRHYGMDLRHEPDRPFRHPGEVTLGIEDRHIVMIVTKPDGEQITVDVSGASHYEHMWAQFGAKWNTGEVEMEIFELTVGKTRLCI